MKLYLDGHDYKYAVEQILLALFPEERPEYCASFETSDGLAAASRLSFGKVYAQAVTVIRRGGEETRGISRVRLDRLGEKLAADRLLQRIIKQSFYKAAERFLETPPVWGSLTGIRPAQLAVAALVSGKSKESAKNSLIRDYHVSPERAELCIDAARSAVNIKQSLEPMDVALYIGIPFCPSRCAYCSFVSNSVEKSFALIEPFVQVLLREIEAVGGLVNAVGMRVIAVYIGGGTPTTLSETEIEAVMRTLEKSIDLKHVREYTVEAGRPDTITEQKLEIMQRFGAMRICVNPQSMSREVLAAIGRKHSPEDVLTAAKIVRQNGMALNMDVIAGLPGDTTEGFAHTLDTVLSLKSENVTIHTLSLKKGSRIMLEGTLIPSGADVAVMLEYAARRLRESGLLPYYLYRQKFTSGGFENIGWCTAGSEGLYNICMMDELCTVLALGGGGVTKLVSGNGRIERIFNAKYPREYIMQKDKLNDKTERVKEFYHAISLQH